MSKKAKPVEVVTTKHFPMEAVVLTDDEGKNSKSLNSTAMTFVEEGQNIYLHRPVDVMTPGELIRALAVVTRLSNAVERRKSKLRKKFDEMRDENPIDPSEKEHIYTAGGFKVVESNKNFGQRRINPDKAIELVKKKKIGVDRITIQPPPPPPVFSEEKFKALVTLGIIDEKELQSVTDWVDPSVMVTVEVAYEIDEAISRAVLGPHVEKKSLKLKK